MGSEKIPVSCYIRTLNEAPRIEAVLAAVRDLVSEIVIIDSGSTDGTGMIAEAMGARVVIQSWLGNGYQKRFGEDQCRHDFLLDLDADEVVSPELAAEIRSQFAAGQPLHSIYALKLVTVPPVGDPWLNFGYSYRNKLYDRRVVRAPEHKAWDQFEVPAGAKVGRLSGPLLHHVFRDLAHHAEKMNRISSVRANEGHKRSRLGVGLRVLFALPVYFFKHFVMRGLFRAGMYGFACAGIAAYGRWLRDVKMYEQFLLQKKSRRRTDRKTSGDFSDGVIPPEPRNEAGNAVVDRSARCKPGDAR